MPADLRDWSIATGNGSDYNIVFPDLVAGDILVLAQFADTGTLAALTNPSGFGSPLLSVNASSGNMRGKLWVKEAIGSEAGNLGLEQNFNADGVAHLWVVQDGILPTSAASSTAGTGTSISTPGITPGGANDLEARFAACDGGGSSRTLTPAAGFTEPSGADANSGGFTTSAGGYRLLSSSASTSAANWTASGAITSAARLGFTVAIESKPSGRPRPPHVSPAAVHRASRW